MHASGMQVTYLRVAQPPMHHRTLRAPSGTPARAQLCIALGSYTRGVCYGNSAKGHVVNCAPFAHKSQYMRVQRPSECALCLHFEFARPFARLPSALQQRRFEPHQLVVVACAGKFAAPVHHYCGHLGSGEYLKAQLGQLFRKVCQGRGLPAAWPSSEYQSEYVRLPLMRPCSTKTGNSSAACICTRSRTRAPSVTTFAAARCAREDSPLAVPLSNRSCSRSIRDFLDDLDSVIGALCSREYA